jgi:hypothetical protein
MAIFAREQARRMAAVSTSLNELGLSISTINSLKDFGKLAIFCSRQAA